MPPVDRRSSSADLAVIDRRSFAGLHLVVLLVLLGGCTSTELERGMVAISAGAAVESAASRILATHVTTRAREIADQTIASGEFMAGRQELGKLEKQAAGATLALAALQGSLDLSQRTLIAVRKKVLPVAELVHAVADLMRNVTLVREAFAVLGVELK